jgi:plasmid stabilization system protein ParE
MSYFVRPLRRAVHDIDEIYQWLVRRSKSGADRWYAAFLKAASELEHFPDRHPLAPEGEQFTEDIRHLFFRTRRGRTYRILFTIVGSEVRLLRVRGPGQNILEENELGS